MKKGIRFFVVFIFLFFISLDSKAKILPEGGEGDYLTGGCYVCGEEAEFNYLVGRDSIKETDPFISDINNVLKKTSVSYASFEGTFYTTDNKESVDFSCMMEISGTSIRKLTYQINITTVYVLEKNNDKYIATTNIPVDLNYYAGTRNKLFMLPENKNHFNTNINFTGIEYVAGYFDSTVRSVLMGYRVYENDKYLNKDLCFVVDSCNPLSEADIIKSLDVNDTTCGKIDTLNISIVDSDYEIVNNYVTPGTYDMTIKAWDNNGNITYQKCRVISADVTAPVLTCPDKVEAEAYVLLTEDQILSAFNVVDEYSSVTLEIENDDYSANYEKVGSYNVSVKAYDEAGNVTRGSVVVEVIDNTDPVITFEGKYFTTDEPLTMADLRSRITVYDDVDGIITDYIIHDYNGYFDHPNIPGEYEFEVEATDSHTNNTSFYFSLYVVDKNGPSIEAPKYTVMLNKGEAVTKEQILQILKASGQISSTENVTLHSFYFDSLNPEGEYDLEVIADGVTYHDVIRFVDKNENKKEDDSFYNIPLKKEDNNNNTYYIVLGISVGVIVILSALGVIIYKKKH